jgi:hypothetical protein
MGAAIGQALGQAIGNAIRGNPEEDARKAAAIARQNEENARRRAEEEAARRRAEEQELKRHEEMKSRLLGDMLDVGESSQLGLMGTDSGSGSGLGLMTDDQAVSASINPDKANQKTEQPSQPKPAGFTKGFEDASQCHSQNSGSHCAGVTAGQQDACLADYRAGYSEGDKQRARLMQEAMQAGQLAGERGELANGASNPLAEGPCRIDWIVTYNKGYFQGKHAKAGELKPAIAATAKVDSEVARIINSMNALAKRLGWSADERARLDKALNKLAADGDGTSEQSRRVWQDVLARGQESNFAQEASQGDGPGFPGAGQQSHNDCAIFALANASGQPYGVVAARAAKLIGEGEWRDATERANPQKVIEQKGLIGGEVVMLAEALGQVNVVASTDFAKTLKGGRPVMVSVVPVNGDFRDGHEVVLTKAFQHDGETWYEMMDSNQGAQRRLYMSAKELTTMQKENGVAFRPESKTAPKLLR